MPKIEVYTTHHCPYCTKAKNLLTSRGIEFEEIVVAMDDDATWDKLEKRSGGMQTVPQIYRDGKIIGGYTDLAELDGKDELKSLR